MYRTKNVSLLFVLLLSIIVASCKNGDDSPPTPEEQRLIDLAGTTGVTYEATSVTFGGTPDPRFENFTLTLRASATSQTYTTTNGSPVFRASGSWTFNDNNINQILIDGNSNNIFVVSAFNASAGTFTLTVNFVAAGGVAAGVNGTNGTYVFNLQKQ